MPFTPEYTQPWSVYMFWGETQSFMNARQALTKGGKTVVPRKVLHSHANQNIQKILVNITTNIRKTSVRKKLYCQVITYGYIKKII